MDYRYFVSYYRGKDKQKESEIEVLDNITEKKRGMGAVICMCSALGALRENVLQIPYWYI